MKNSSNITNIIIREFKKNDIPEIVEILKSNGQYSHPRVDGPEAMLRISKNPYAVFYIAEIEDRIIGVVRGVYDGSRALIHQISVHPNFQRKGIGFELIKSIASEFKKKGAPSVSVTAGRGDLWDSIGFFEKLGFKDMPIKLMVHFDINELIKE